MKVKGVDRERKRWKRRYGMRMDGANLRRVQLALLYRDADRGQQVLASGKNRRPRRP